MSAQARTYDRPCSWTAQLWGIMALKTTKENWVLRGLCLLSGSNMTAHTTSSCVWQAELGPSPRYPGSWPTRSGQKFSRAENTRGIRTSGFNLTNDDSHFSLGFSAMNLLRNNHEAPNVMRAMLKSSILCTQVFRLRFDRPGLAAPYNGVWDARQGAVFRLSGFVQPAGDFAAGTSSGRAASYILQWKSRGLESRVNCFATCSRQTLNEPSKAASYQRVQLRLMHPWPLSAECNMEAKKALSRLFCWGLPAQILT